MLTMATATICLDWVDETARDWLPIGRLWIAFPWTVLIDWTQSLMSV